MSLQFQLSHASPDAVNTPLLALILPQSASFEDAGLSSSLSALDAGLHNTLSLTLNRRDFRGQRDEVLFLPGAANGVQRILLVGYGKSPLTRSSARRAAAIAARNAAKLGVGALSIWTHLEAAASSAQVVEGLVTGSALGAWTYTDYQTLPPEAERRAKVSAIAVLAPESQELDKAFEAGVAIAEGQALARKLGQMPANVCIPDTFAEVARDIASRLGMQATVWGRHEIAAAGMGSFLAVAQGTTQEPRLVTLEYRGGLPDQQPVVLIGKGLCFDTGGISIKPAADMEWMKFDMSGAGGVMGAMETIGRLRPPVNVVGIVGSTTNMPSGESMKPGDVVRASNGKTIEIINTDAEGRLVLADLLAYAKRFKPALAIDAATLTGSIVIGLGHQAVGVFGNDRERIDEVLAAGELSGEPGWPMPLWDEYKEQIKSDVADIKNTGGRPAGSITAAAFLQEFVDDYPWVHLDVAGTAYSQSDLGWIPKGPTGTPVGTFVEVVRARANPLR